MILDLPSADRIGSDAGVHHWNCCRFLTCSVLPVRMACNLACRFCFSKSSISALRAEGTGWSVEELRRYYGHACEKGARRLVITGGGEPLLRPELVRTAIQCGSEFFDEIALFTNGTFLTGALAGALVDDGLSYVCFSRHHHDDQRNRELMGGPAMALEEFFRRIAGRVRVRATCVMCRGYVENTAEARAYTERLAEFGVTEFTFKHTYLAYEQSIFKSSDENGWVETSQIQTDPFPGDGEVIARLPWGPEIKRMGQLQVCYYYEPTPNWELNHQLCRSINLLADGSIYASLEDQRSRLSPPRN